MGIRRVRLQITLRGTAGWILVFGIGCLVLWLGTGEPPAEQELRHWRGPLLEVALGGEGHATWMTGEVEGQALRFQSLHGLDWPGMEELQRGTVVDLWFARDPLPRRGPGHGQTYWIWRLVEDGREVVPYAGVVALWSRDRRWLGWAGVGLLCAALALGLIARTEGAAPPRASASRT